MRVWDFYSQNGTLGSELLDNLDDSAKVRRKRCSLSHNAQGASFMKNVYEVLRQKEMELTRLEQEVEALRLVAPLLSEEKEMPADIVKSLATAVNGPQAPMRMATAPVPAAIAQPVRAAGWDDTAKRWP